MTVGLCCQDGAHGHQRQRQVQLPPDVLQQGGVAPELAEPDSVSFASGAGDAVLLTSTGDDDMIDAQATMHLPSTGMRFQNLHLLCVAQLIRVVSDTMGNHSAMFCSTCAVGFCTSRWGVSCCLGPPCCLLHH